MPLSSSIRLAVRAAQAAAVALSLYQAAVTLLGYVVPRKVTPSQSPQSPESLPTFAAVICARNEERVIGDILQDLENQEYPADRLHVTVVAHNCTDSTAQIAECRGARVVILDDGRAGKVAAMLAALENIPASTYVAVFDADARIPSKLMAIVAREISGRSALQVETVPALAHNRLEAAYGFGRESRNVLWWRPRSRLGLGTTLTGSGFFVRPALLEQMLPEIRTGTEDLELTARLAIAGHTVAFTTATQAIVEEPAALSASLNQRSRWVRGHMGTLLRTWPQLMLRAMRGDMRAFDLAVFMIAPTRVLTRAAVAVALLIRLLLPATSVPLVPIARATAAELFIPIGICAKTGILRLDRRGLGIALEHVLLGFLWFPIGAWSIVTARRVAWSPVPRQRRGERTV